MSNCAENRKESSMPEKHFVSSKSREGSDKIQNGRVASTEKKRKQNMFKLQTWI